MAITWRKEQQLELNRFVALGASDFIVRHFLNITAPAAE